MKPVDVEPLSEERWTTVERGVFHALDAQPRAADSAVRRGPLLAGAFALGLAAACAALILLRDAPAAPHARAIVTASEPESVAFARVNVEASPHTNLTLVATPRAQARLHDGQAQFSVPADVALELALGHVLVRASGVRFVASYSARRPALAVEDGALTVVDGANQVVVARGERWPASSKPAAEPAAVPAEPDASGGAPALQPRPRLQPARATTPPVRPSAASQEQRYEQAARIEGTEPDTASALYRALGREHGGWAENALFALGRLQLERGRRAEGRATLEAYLTRYPRGRNAGDARRLLGSQD